MMRQRLCQNLMSNRVSIFSNALFQTDSPPPKCQLQQINQQIMPHQPVVDNHLNAGTIKHQAIFLPPDKNYKEHRNKIFSCQTIDRHHRNKLQDSDISRFHQDRSCSRKKNKIFQQYHPKKGRQSNKAVIFNGAGWDNGPKGKEEICQEKFAKVPSIKLIQEKSQQYLGHKGYYGMDRTQSSSQRSSEEFNLIVKLKNKQILTPNDLADLVKFIRKANQSKTNNPTKNNPTNNKYHQDYRKQ